MKDRIDFLVLRVIEDVRLNWPAITGGILAGTLCMVLIGGVFLTSWSLRRAFPGWLLEGGAVAYVLPGVSLERQNELAAEIAGWSEIDSVRIVSAEEAWRRLQRNFDDWKDVFRGFSNSPLPASIEARFKPSASDWTAKEPVLNKMRRLPEIEEVAPEGDIYAPLGSFFCVVRWARAGMLVLAALALASIVFSVMGQAVAARRDELAAYHCVGATRAFIGAPYYVEGVLQGAASALVAFCVLFAVIAAAGISHSSPLNILLSWRLSDSLLLFGWLLGWGIGLGCLGAWFALRRIFG
jgi:cell division transport system permease protein